MEKVLATLEHDGCTATIYEDALPGKFTIVFHDAKGNVLAEDQLAGVSTYRQREAEIVERLKSLCAGETQKSGELADSGEY